MHWLFTPTQLKRPTHPSVILDVLGVAAPTHASMSTTGVAKRRLRDDTDSELEASLNALTTKLGATTTHDPDSLVATICEVLGVEADTALFYLEASNNDPHAAVHLHVQSLTGALPPQGTAESKRPKPPTPTVYHRIPVQIVGLPGGWSAFVSAAGTIVFQHDESGHEQATVPAAFCAGKEATAAESSKALAGDITGGHMDVGNDVPASPPPGDLLHRPSADNATAIPHPRVTCDSCEGPVVGIRYQCLTRYNFDLCEACMWSEAGDSLRTGHKFMRMSFVGS